MRSLRQYVYTYTPLLRQRTTSTIRRSGKQKKQRSTDLDLRNLEEVEKKKTRSTDLDLRCYAKDHRQEHIRVKSVSIRPRSLPQNQKKWKRGRTEAPTQKKWKTRNQGTDFDLRKSEEVEKKKNEVSTYKERRNKEVPISISEHPKKWKTRNKEVPISISAEEGEKKQ